MGKKNMSVKAVRRRRESAERARRAREAESLAVERQRRAEFEQRLAAARAEALERTQRAQRAVATIEGTPLSIAAGQARPLEAPPMLPPRPMEATSQPPRSRAMRGLLAVLAISLSAGVGPTDPDKG